MKKSLIAVSLSIVFLLSACQNKDTKSGSSETTTVISLETTEKQSEETTEESTSSSSQSSKTKEPVSVSFSKNTTLSYIDYSIEPHVRNICGKKTISLSYDELKIDEKKYPELAHEIDEILEPLYEKTKAEFIRIQADPKQPSDSGDDEDRYCDEYGMSVHVLRNDTSFFVFEISATWRDENWYSSYSINVAKNAVLSFEDIVTDEIAFRNVCLNAGCEPQEFLEIKNRAGEMLFPDYDGVYITKDLFFNEAIKIPYFGNEDMFNSACFSDLPENYLFQRDIEKDPSWTILWDIDGDGMTENIRYDYEETKDYNKCSLNQFVIGDTKTTIDSSRFEDDGVPIQVFFLHVGGNDFLGIIFIEVDMYSSTEIYALHKDKTVEFVECIPDLSIGVYAGCIDPTGFTASKLIPFVGQNNGTGYAAFDESGHFAFRDKVLELDTTWIMYPKNEMTVTRVDPDTRESVGEYNLKTTNQIVFVETDGETYTIMRTLADEQSDSVYFRMKLTKEGEYEFLMEGKNVDDLFRNVFHGC